MLFLKEIIKIIIIVKVLCDKYAMFPGIDICYSDIQTIKSSLKPSVNIESKTF